MMQTNALPKYDSSENTTGCCPKFNPDGWDAQELHFEDKLFVRATTRSVDHVPVDMGEVFEKTFGAVMMAGAYDESDFIVLGHDLSASQAEHFFSVTRPVDGQEIVRWTGDYMTKLFEGPYEDAPNWEAQFEKELKAAGQNPSTFYYFYTTCPKCAVAYGKNYVVGVAELSAPGN